MAIVVAIAAAIVTAVTIKTPIGQEILQFLGINTRSSGDEPPITVKHGTIELNLVSSKNHQKWDKPNGKAFWAIKDKNNQSDYSRTLDHYEVLVGYQFPTDGTTLGCTDGTYKAAKKLVITYTYTPQSPPSSPPTSVTATFEVVADGTTFTTNLTLSTPFSLDGEFRKFTFGKGPAGTGTDDGGYISEIDADGSVWCKFDAAHKPDGIALLDGNE